ncbi:hypothetical protein EST38_g4888 [Candolleomyces aberdarensis]|uniref:F-box domain-containing protein n=1 Tax=Candolleomyces aberdarensis TaxID=2316362 RepID=A0A4Q2DLW3_9AGAR|nr:hypothetical protein EST38_g4888 [Candolleomyces aberdarensis]
MNPSLSAQSLALEWVDILYNIIPRISDSTDTVYGAYKDGHQKGLISASQVNRLWRMVALNLPGAWAEVHDPRDPSLRRYYEILRRARQLPLRLTGLVPVKKVKLMPAINGDGRSATVAMSTAQWRHYLGLVSRIEEIDLTFTGTKRLLASHLVRLADALMSPAPLLERLSITIQSDQPAIFFHDSGRSNDEDILFGSEWFSGNAPRLRHLTMRNIFLDVTRDTLASGLMRGFDSLISLEVDCPGGITFPFFDAWWMYLTRFTKYNPHSRLEHIDITYIYGYVDRHRVVDGSGCPGTLPPRLKSFRLRGDIEPCVWMLGDITEFPQNCDVDLKFWADIVSTYSEPLCSAYEHVLGDLVAYLSRIWASDDCSEISLEISLENLVLQLTSGSGRLISVVVYPFPDPNSNPNLIVRFYSDLLGSLARLESFASGITPETWLKLSILCEPDGISVLAESLIAFLRRFSALRNLHLVHFPLDFRNVKNPVLPSLVRIRLNHSFSYSHAFCNDVSMFVEERARVGQIVEVVEFA